MLNNISLQGRLTANPELRYTQSQTAVASFTLACDRDRADQNGNRECDFIPCVAWGKLGEHVSKWFVKGQMALVSGRIQNRDYTDRNGVNRRTTEIIISSINFCGKKEDNPNNKGVDYSDPRMQSYPGKNDQQNGYQNQGGYQPNQYIQNNTGVNVYAPPDFEEIGDDDGELPFD